MPAVPWQIATWAPDNTIRFTRYQDPGALFRVPAAGGQPVAALTVPSLQTRYSWPSFLPDGLVFPVFRAQRGQALGSARRLARLA